MGELSRRADLAISQARTQLSKWITEAETVEEVQMAFILYIIGARAVLALSA